MIRKRLFGALARLDVSHPWLVILAAASLSILSILYTRARLEFRTGQDDLVSADSRDNRNYLHYTKEFPDLDGLIVVIKAQPSAERAEQFADTLAHRLERDPINVKSVFYRIDPAMMNGRALLYLDSGELNGMARRIGARLPLLRQYADDPSLATLFGIADAEINRATAALAKGAGHGAAPGAADSASIDPRFFAALLNGMIAAPAANPPSPWGGLIDGSGHDSVRDSYVSSDNGKYLLMQVSPGKGVRHGADPVDVIQGDVDAVRGQFPDVTAGMTGGPALAHAEQTTTQHDMALASVIAVAGLVLLLVIPFRGVVEPAFAIIALLVGVAWSFGFTTLAVGHLNLLSAVFTSVLAGIGINFPIHLMARYDEARRKGLAMPAAVELAVVNTGTGVFASACIMALAFLMPMFTDFKGIAELGEISAAGLFLCLVAALLVFPALLALRDRGRPALAAPKLSLAPPRSMLERMFARPGLVIAIAVAGTLAAAVFARGVRFDQNLLKLQADGAEAVRFENVLLRDSGRSSWFAVALAPTRAGADRKAAAFRKLPEVSGAETLSTYIPEHQAERRAILAGLARELAPISIHADGIRENSPRLMRELTDLAARLEAMRTADSSGVAGRIEALVRQAIAKLARDPNAFVPYEHRIAAGLDTQLKVLKAQLSPGEITAANLPPVLRQRFIGASGQYLVQVYPKGDIWADAVLKNFVTALKTVDSDVTGPPVQTYTIATVMRRGYERAAVLALIAVFVFVFADFRNLRDTLLATVPLVFGGAWLLEAMGALGWDFNLANLFALPIIIGMGVDNGVNMLYRWREERDKSSLILTKAVGKSVTICSLTTIAAFAALIPAAHRGISSLGWVLTIGVSFILIATLVVLPALFELFGSRIERDGAPAIASRQVVDEEAPEYPRRQASR
jgi:hopanoid biosynthesis associated RND transporter like protein HpnN